MHIVNALGDDDGPPLARRRVRKRGGVIGAILRWQLDMMSVFVSRAVQALRNAHSLKMYPTPSWLPSWVARSRSGRCISRYLEYGHGGELASQRNLFAGGGCRHRPEQASAAPN